MTKVSNAKLYEAVNSSRLAQENALRELTETLSKPTQNLGVFNDNLTNLNNLLTTMSDNISKSSKKKEESDNKLSNITNTLTKRFSNLAKVVADTANRYSQISNELITVSGATGSNVRETRAEIVQGIVKQLNKETGNFLNPEKSYQKMVDIANQANIGNLEALEEITRPMLLASETMNVKNAELASLFNRWYTRYNFSSLQMESMVDEIRGNTAGNNATAEATMENISKFQNFIGVYADSTKEMQNMVEAISQESSRLESVGINSGYIFDYMKQIGQGDTSNITAIQSLLSNSNTGMNWTEAQSLLRSGNAGDMKLVSEALAEGAKSIGDKVKDNTLSAEAIKAYGLDVEEIYNILSASGVLKNSDEFMDSVSGAQSAVESLDDKFNTHTDKLNNIVLTLSERFAKFQENWGVAISDFLKVGGLIYAAIQFRDAFGGGLRGASLGSLGMNSGVRGILSTNFMSTWLSSRGFTGTAGAMNSAGTGLSKLAGLGGGLGGTAMLAGGLSAGALLGLDGIKGVKDDTQSTSSRVFSGMEAGLGIGGMAGLIGLGVTNPVGWAALGLGGVAFLLKKSTELTGNAEKVADQIHNVGDSLKKENESRLDQLDVLTKNFYTAETLEEQQNLMKESGLFQDQDFSNQSEEAMQELLRSYRSAATEMDKITEKIIKTSSKYYADKAKDMQESFFEDLSHSDLSDAQWMEVLSMMKNDPDMDPKAIKKIDKIMKDGKVSQNEIRRIENLSSSAISGDTVDTITNYMVSNGFDDWEGKSYNAELNYDYIMGALSILNDKNTTEKIFKDKVKEVRSKGLENELVGAYNNVSVQTMAQGHEWYNPENTYRTGSNYIESDQTARIHEGEAVVPKKYNPAANVTELEMLRKYYKESTTRGESESLANIRELISVMSDIREFLAMWKDDNDKREDLKSRSSRLNASSDYIARFMATSY